MKRRLVLYKSAVVDFDGAYDWVKAEEYNDPDMALGYHPGIWTGEGYTVVEVEYDPDEWARHSGTGEPLPVADTTPLQ
jgi:hypothetical protein